MHYAREFRRYSWRTEPEIFEGLDLIEFAHLFEFCLLSESKRDAVHAEDRYVACLDQTVPDLERSPRNARASLETS